MMEIPFWVVERIKQRKVYEPWYLIPSEDFVRGRRCDHAVVLITLCKCRICCHTVKLKEGGGWDGRVGGSREEERKEGQPEEETSGSIW